MTAEAQSSYPTPISVSFALSVGEQTEEHISIHYDPLQVPVYHIRNTFSSFAGHGIGDVIVVKHT